jgi:hypothetical protein
MRFWRRLLYRDANRNDLGTPEKSYAPALTYPDSGLSERRVRQSALFPSSK